MKLDNWCPNIIQKRTPVNSGLVYRVRCESDSKCDQTETVYVSHNTTLDDYNLCSERSSILKNRFSQALLILDIKRIRTNTPYLLTHAILSPFRERIKQKCAKTARHDMIVQMDLETHTRTRQWLASIAEFQGRRKPFFFGEGRRRKSCGVENCRANQKKRAYPVRKLKGRNQTVQGCKYANCIYYQKRFVELERQRELVCELPHGIQEVQKYRRALTIQNATQKAWINIVQNRTLTIQNKRGVVERDC